MKAKKNILFVASEVFPFAKSGGLADVAYALPKALSEHMNVDVVMPLYRSIDRKKYNIQKLPKGFQIHIDAQEYEVTLYQCTYNAMQYYFIYSPILCDKEFLYGTPESGYDDNALRFCIFSHAVVMILKDKKYDLAHLNDWQSALVALLLKEQNSLKTKTLYTIHNLAYQGVFEKDVLPQIGISEEFFHMDALEFFDQVNFMKAGIAFADLVTTVSPTYAKEILTQEFGCGLDGFLRHHRSKLVGVINGIDTEFFSPSSDRALRYPYSNVTRKALNKNEYLKEIQLKGQKKPLFIFIGRFTWQKGVETLVEVLEELGSMKCNISILGDGEMKYHSALKRIASEYKNINLQFGYDESLSHRMYAAADFLLMPSVFEPCGLNQMIAMHYGTTPVVHKVGGLSDTVEVIESCQRDKRKGCGIVFDVLSKQTLLKSIQKAIALYSDRSKHTEIIKHNMKCDFSWQSSAMEYEKLYKRVLNG